MVHQMVYIFHFLQKIHPEPLADAPGHSPQPARIGISPLTQQQLEPETRDLQGGLGPCHGKMRWNMVENDGTMWKYSIRKLETMVV